MCKDGVVDETVRKADPDDRPIDTYKFIDHVCSPDFQARFGHCTSPLGNWDAPKGPIAHMRLISAVRTCLADVSPTNLFPVTQ